MAEEKKVRYGLIGLGKIGTQHTKKLVQGAVPNLDYVAVADIDPKALEKAKELIGPQVKTFSTAEELIKSGEVDAIHICVPHYWHPTYAIMGLEAGLNVLVEKPAGVYVKQVRKMDEVARRHPSQVYAMDFNLRTNPVYQKARELMQQGVIGQMQHTNWIVTNWYRPQSYYDMGGWRATWAGEGGGVLLNQNPHNLDLLQWICGMPSRVKTKMYYGKWRNVEVEDEMEALLEWNNGATGLYMTTISDWPGTNRIEIDGDKGKMVVEDGKTITIYPIEPSCSEFNRTFKGGLGKPKTLEPYQVPVEGTYTAHMGIIRNFCDAILDHTQLFASGFEGINALQVSNAMHLSSWLDDWVDVPVDEDLFLEKLKEKVASSKVNNVWCGQ